MAEKIADAYVEVHLRDNTGDINRVLNRLSRSGTTAGTRTGDVFSRSFLRSVSRVTSPFNALFMAALRPGAFLTFAGAAGVAAAGVGIFTAAVSDSMKALDLYQQGLIDPKKMAQFKKQMALMTETQRSFTWFMIKEMMPALGKLKAIASENMLPGLETGLRKALSLMPILEKHTASTAKIMGNFFDKLGSLFQQSHFQKNLDIWMSSLEGFAHTVGTVMIQLVDRIVQFGAEIRPVTEAVGMFVQHVGNGLVGAMNALAPHAEAFARVWEALGRIIEVLLPLLAELAAWLAEYLAPILETVAGWLEANKEEIRAMIPFVAGLVLAMKGLSILGNIAKWFGALTAVLKGFKLAEGFSKFITFVTSPGFLTFLGSAAAIFGVAAAITALKKALGIDDDELAGVVEEGQGKGDNIFEEINTWMENLKRDFGPFIEWLTNQLMIMSNTISMALLGIRMVGQAFSEWWNGLWAGVERAIANVRAWWNNNWLTMENAWRNFQIVLAAVGAAITGWWNGFWAGLESRIQAAARFIQSVIQAIINAINRVIAAYNSLPGVPDIPFVSGAGAAIGGSGGGARPAGQAKGGISHGGLTMVGEHGPELVRLPRGSSVRSNSDTRRMLSAGSGGQGSGGGQITFKGNLDGAFATAFMYLVRSGQIQIAST